MTDNELLALAETIIEDGGMCPNRPQIIRATIDEIERDSDCIVNKRETTCMIEMPHAVWSNVQWNGKGTERGTLVVLDFGDRRVLNFC